MRSGARIQTDPIDAGAALAAFCIDRPQSGAVVSFVGQARATTDGAPVLGMTVDAYPGFTDRVLEALVDETRSRFRVDDAAVVHRWGAIAVGEPIVFVAVAAVHRRAAFEAADFLMDQLKTRAPFWKMERGVDGDRWIDARPQDHDDAARWRKE